VVAFRAVHDLEAAELRRDALARLRKAGADMIVVNDVSRQGVGFESETNEVTVFTPDGKTRQLPREDKLLVASRILGLVDLPSGQAGP